MAQKPHPDPVHILLQSLAPTPVAAPPPGAGAGGWPEWTRTAPSGSGGTGRGQEVKVAGQQEHWCGQRGLPLHSRPLRSQAFQVLHFSLQHRHGSQSRAFVPAAPWLGQSSPVRLPRFFSPRFLLVNSHTWRSQTRKFCRAFWVVGGPSPPEWAHGCFGGQTARSAALCPVRGVDLYVVGSCWGRQQNQGS